MIDLALWRGNRGYREIVNKFSVNLGAFLSRGGPGKDPEFGLLPIWSQIVIKQSSVLGPGFSGPAWAIYRRWQARVAK